MSPLGLLGLVFAGALVLGAPIFVAFGLAGFAYLSPAGVPVVQGPAGMFGAIDSFALMAVPFFVLAGDIMREGGVSRRLIAFVSRLVGRRRGALGAITLIAAAFFSAISGSSAADTAAIGGVMIPEMVRHGYDRRYAATLAAVSGFTGGLIPPSIVFVIYGIAAGVSIGDLFIAGILPGVLALLAFLTVNYFMTRRMEAGEESVDMAPEAEVAVGPGGAAALARPRESVWQLAWSALPGLVMPAIILGGMYAGIFTATEAAAVAAMYGAAVGRWVYRGLNARTFWRTCTESAITAASVLIIIACAGLFGWVITVNQVPQAIARTILGLTANKYVLLLLLNGVYLVLGMFVETVTIILLTTPIVLPIIKAVGIDPLHFGVLLIVNLSVGLMTPPMAICVFVACKIARVRIADVVRPILPFVLAAVAVLAVVTYVPEVSLFLPRLLRH